MTNAHDNRTSLIQIAKNVHNFVKNVACGVYFVSRRTRACSSKSKTRSRFLEASLAKKKANMSENWESFKSIFAEVSCISKELNDASMS